MQVVFFLFSFSKGAQLQMYRRAPNLLYQNGFKGLVKVYFGLRFSYSNTQMQAGGRETGRKEEGERAGRGGGKGRGGGEVRGKGGGGGGEEGGHQSARGK